MKKFLSLFLLLFCTAGFMSAATPTVIFSEGFAGFTEGSENEPATVDISSFTSGKLKKVLTGWSGSKVYEAGGMLKINDFGYLQSSFYDMSANSGVIKISARVRIAGTEGGGIVRINLGYSISKEFAFYDNDWHDVSFVTSGGNSYSAVKVSPQYCINGILIDSLSVETSPDLFPAPEAYQPRTANGVSFTALWSTVKGATAYILDVYTKNGDTKEYVLQNDTVKYTLKDVQNLDADKTYYFTVRATNGTATSDYSNEIEVVKVVSELEAPTATAATNVTSTSFTANWEPLADAESYLVNIYKRSKMTTEGPVALIADDFSKVTKGTMDNVEYGSIDGNLDDYTKAPGWYGDSHAFAKGMIVLSPWSAKATLTTPFIDLTNNGGQVQVKLNMASYFLGKYATDSVTVYLVNGEDVAVDSVQQVLTEGFSEYTINLKNGTNLSAVRVSYNGVNKIFIEDMKVIQVVPAGYELEELIETLPARDTHLDVTVTEPMSDVVSYAYTVQGVAKTVDYYGGIADIFSIESNKINVKEEVTGVDENLAEKTVTAVKYIDLTGKTSTQPFNGVNIVVTTYSDGTTKTAKVLK